MKKIILVSFLLVFFMGLASANGLNILSGNSLQLNKSQGIDFLFNMSVRNTESFSFFNITSSNSILQFDPFNLNSGENKTILAKIHTDTPFNGQISIKGLYQQNIGASNQTKVIYINYQTGISECNLNQIVGDRIIFVNQVADNIKLINAVSGNEIATINQGDNYTMPLSSPQEFSYYATRIGLPFTETCSVSTQDSQGLVHNSQYDALFMLNLSMIYNPTTLSLTLFSSNYNLSYNEQKQDVLQIKNTGSELARSVHLSGDWLTFSENDFNLNAGDTKNIMYTITPLIFETNQTDKSYNLPLKITGNFPNINNNISVYIKYASISNGLTGNTSIDESVLENFFKLYCLGHPTFSYCQQPSNLSNSSQRIVSAIFTEETVKDLLQKQAEASDNQATMDKRQQENQINTSTAINNLTLTQQEQNTKIEQLSKSQDDNSSVTIFVIIFVLTLFCISIFGYILLNERARNKIARKLGLSQGEAEW